jgi:hypothetical protein
MTGAERAQVQPDTGFGETIAAEPDWLGPAEIEAPEAPSAQAPRGLGVKLFGALLLLLALCWIGAFGWSLWQTRPAVPTLSMAIGWIATLSGPLVLLGLLWLLLGRTGRRETERFTRAIEAMRAESNALESVLGIVAGRIEENHARLRGEAEKLMSLGDEASDRLGRVTHYLSRETVTLDQKAAALESAAAGAKVDIGVLLHDLPRAEEQARAVADAMKEAGLTAHGHAGALEAQLSALGARGREADEVLGGAAQRLAAHVARIESSAAAAASGMDQASAGMTAAVDWAMSRATQALDAARAGLEAQSGAMLAAIEHSRAALDKAGEDASRNLGQRLDAISGKIGELAGHLSAQDAASHALVTGLGKELAELDDWFQQLGRTGSAQTERLSGSVGAIREALESLIGELGGGRDQADVLIDRARTMSELLTGATEQLEGPLPDALSDVEALAGRTQASVQSLAPIVEGISASAGHVEGRMENIGGKAEQIAAMLAAQGTASREITAGLLREVAELHEAFAAVESRGSGSAGEISGALRALREAANDLNHELAGGEARAGELSGRAQEIAEALRQVTAQLDGELPAALQRVEAQAHRSRAAAASLTPLVEALESSTVAMATRLAEADASALRQREAFDSLLARIEEGVGTAETQLLALGAAAGQAEDTSARIVADTAPELIDALLRVRETANQAAERAREAISSVIPSSAAALGEAGREALSVAISDTVERQMAELSSLSERAFRAAREASERLTRQMLALGDSAATIEARIEDARKERDEKESESFSRRVALLIESLNSTAIDVTKILSNDVTDSAWAAYLKGDRGVFTRRAVRLLDTGEAREIARHYEEEPEFREQVNRYIHDFEAMLRRILADRDGSPLGVTILSSDMGKLYVALAQAIERLRK